MTDRDEGENAVTVAVSSNEDTCALSTVDSTLLHSNTLPFPGDRNVSFRRLEAATD